MIRPLLTSLIPLLLEASLRALLAATAIWAGLRLLRVGNVLVQKAAWSLVLLAALALPVAPRVGILPALRLPALPLLSASSSQAATSAVPPPSAATVTPAVQATEKLSPEMQEVSGSNLSRAVPAAKSTRTLAPEQRPASSATGVTPNVDMGTAFVTSQLLNSETNFATEPQFNITTHTAQQAPAAAQRQTPRLGWPALAALLYLGIFAALLLRILIGLGAALRLWTTAEPVQSPNLAPLIADTVGNIPVRFSLRVASPINIGAGIVLPADYAEWDRQKLRVVLAHEHSHIRQGDFYLQLLAGLYAAFFWFSPLGWWLKRKLSELGEAISDRAGLQHAASPSSYAQLLLEFAALPRPTLTGVAMARRSNLTQRIERLLNESAFSQAFAAGKRRALLAVLFVPIALFVSTAIVRVEAAAQAPAAPPAQADQTTGQSTPEQVTESAPPPAPEDAPAPPPPGAMQTPPPPPPPAGADDQAPAPMTPMPPMPPMPPIHVQVKSDDLHVHIDPKDMQIRIDPQIRMEIASAREEMRMARDFNFSGFGDPYALVGDPGSKPRFSGSWNSNRDAEIEKARKVAHGHFLWFRHDGKSYIVDDPSVVAQVEAMNKPVDELGEQMRAMGNQMRAAGEKQRAEGQKMRDVAVPTPDLSKQLAELTAAAESLRAKQGGTISQKDLGDLERKIGRIQGDLGALQGKLMSQQLNLAGQMGQFSGQMGELGGKMGELSGKMGKLSIENRQKVGVIIDESLKNNRAKPVN